MSDIARMIAVPVVAYGAYRLARLLWKIWMESEQ